MKKKILSLLIAIAVIMVSVCGCGAGAQSSSGTDAKANTEAASGEKAASSDTASSDGLYVFEMMPNAVFEDKSTDCTVGQYIADKFGIEIDFIQYAGDMVEKQAMLLASGDYGEIQCMQGQNMVKQYIDAGALINLDDYKDILPDFYETFKEQIPYWRTSAADGGLYVWEGGAPLTYPSMLPHQDICVRTDVLEYYGWPNLVTASDWISFLEQAAKDFPETYDGQYTVGMSVSMAESWGAGGIATCGYEKGSTYHNPSNDFYVWNVETEKFEDYALNPEVKENIQFFNELYNKGLLDEECFTDYDSNINEKMCSGRPIAVWYSKWNMDSANSALVAAGHPEMQYIELPFQLDSQKGQGRNLPMVTSYPFNSYGVTKNCRDVEKVLKFINWCASEEGQILLQSGIEGVHYTVEDGKRVATDLRKQCSADYEVAKKEGLFAGEEFALYGLPCVFAEAKDGQPYNLANEQSYKDEFGLSDRQKEAFQKLGWKNSNAWWEENGIAIDPGYSSSCALDTTSDEGKTGAKMTELRTKYIASLIVADDFDSVWDNFMAEYDLLDHEAVLDALNNKLVEVRGY